MMTGNCVTTVVTLISYRSFPLNLSLCPTRRLMTSPPTSPHSEGESAAVAVDPVTGEPKAHWSQSDEDKPIDFLITKKALAGEGSNFKKTTWTEAAQHMLPTLKGGTKTADVCKTKWARVCPLIFCPTMVYLTVCFR